MIPTLRTVPACELPPQVHVGAQPTREGFKAPTEWRVCSKPKSGGFWTSSLTEDGTSGWIDWCRGEEWGEVDQKHWWRLSTPIGTPVLVIDTYEDLERLDARYGRPMYPESPIRLLDFDAMVADRWAGLHLTEAGQWATRLSDPINLYGWDCESTLWFQWHFAAPTPIDRVHFASQRSTQ